MPPLRGFEGGSVKNLGVSSCDLAQLIEENLSFRCNLLDTSLLIRFEFLRQISINHRPSHLCQQVCSTRGPPLSFEAVKKGGTKAQKSASFRLTEW